VANGVGHRSTDTDGRVVHDQIGEAEHDLSEGLGEAEDGFLQILADVSECNGEDDGEDSDLQDLIFRDRFDDVFGKDVEKEVVPAKCSGFRRSLRDGGCGEDQTFACPGEIYGKDANEESDGGDNLEVQEAFPADAPNFAEVAVPGNSGDQRAENERSDNDFDEAEKDVTENAYLNSEGWGVEAQFEAGKHGEKDPESKRTFPNTGYRENEKADATEDDQWYAVRGKGKLHCAGDKEEQTAS